MLHPDVFPCSHQCKSGLHQIAQKNARTKKHTRRAEQPQARHNDAPSDRMQPPGERKWLYPPKQCRMQSDTALQFDEKLQLWHKAQTETKIVGKINHYTFMYISKTLFWLYDNVSLQAFIYRTPPSSHQYTNT